MGERALPPWMGPPSGVLPCAIPIADVVARNEEVAVGIAGAFAYPSGFALEIVVLAARRSTRIDPFRDYGYPDIHEGDIPAGLLRLGLEYPDGRKSMNTNFSWPEEASVDESQPTMMEQGGSGGDREWRQSFWFWPLPSPGPFHLVCEWPALKVPLTRHLIDSEQILEAAARAKELYPSDTR